MSSDAGGTDIGGIGKVKTPEKRRSDRAGGVKSISVVTRMVFAASSERIWGELLFYEQILDPPPLHLRLVLPVPMGVEGRKSQVGDTARCLYEGGFLMKRVTGIERGLRYEFEILEQNLPVGGGMSLQGGSYALRRLRQGCTEVSLTTAYMSPMRPRWLWRRLESVVCHAFHRHILRSMRRKIETCTNEEADWRAARPDSPRMETRFARLPQ